MSFSVLPGAIAPGGENGPKSLRLITCCCSDDELGSQVITTRECGQDPSVDRPTSPGALPPRGGGRTWTAVVGAVASAAAPFVKAWAASEGGRGCPLSLAKSLSPYGSTPPSAER